MDPLIKKYLGDKYSDEERANVEEQAREAKNKTAWLQAASGFGEALAGRAPTQSGQYFGGLREGIDKDTLGRFEQGKKSALMDYDLKQKLKADEASEQESAQESDMNSMETQAHRQIGLQLGMTPDQVNKMSAKQLKKLNPMFGEIFKMKQDAQLKREAMQDRRNVEQDRREAREASNLMKKQKADELSLGQTKQLGTYQLGKLAEEQFQKATSDKSKYDPVSVGQILDNSQWAPAWLMSDEAGTARAAKESWVEVFLRDASGAAIPEDERLNYARPYFPEPGDNEQTIKNKLAARQQKMKNALIGSGQQAGPALPLDQQQPQAQEPDVVAYAQKHGISYEEALQNKRARGGK